MSDDKRRPDYEALRKTLEYIHSNLVDRVDKMEEVRREDLVKEYRFSDEEEYMTACLAFRSGFTDGIIQFILMMESELSQEIIDLYNDTVCLHMCPECREMKLESQDFRDIYNNLCFGSVTCPKCGYHKEFEWHKYCVNTGRVKEEKE